MAYRKGDRVHVLNCTMGGTFIIEGGCFVGRGTREHGEGVALYGGMPAVELGHQRLSKWCWLICGPNVDGMRRANAP